MIFLTISLIRNIILVYTYMLHVYIVYLIVVYLERERESERECEREKERKMCTSSTYAEFNYLAGRMRARVRYY